MNNQSFRGIGPIVFLMFVAAGATVFFPTSIGFVVAFAACFVVASVAAIADRVAGAGVTRDTGPTSE